jgi:hypothetical protein
MLDFLARLNAYFSRVRIELKIEIQGEVANDRDAQLADLSQ